MEKLQQNKKLVINDLEAEVVKRIFSMYLEGSSGCYVLGTFLAIYAHKYCDFNDIVNLNNHIHELDYKSIIDICLSIGIDLNDEGFSQKLFDCIDEYINTKQIDHKKCI